MGNLINIRYNQRNEDVQSVRSAKLLEPVSLQRRLISNLISKNDDPSQNGEPRGLFRRQHYSHQAHVDRIRGNSPSYNSEEVMKLKNELAM